MKTWLLVIGIVFSLSAWAEDGPVVIVFTRDIHLSPECKVIARPSVINSQVYYSCPEMSVRFMKAGNVNVEYLQKHDIIGRIIEETIDGKEYYLIETKYGKEPQYIYVICDNEVCMSITSLNTDAIESVVRQVSSEVLHKKNTRYAPSGPDAKKPRAAGARRYVHN